MASNPFSYTDDTLKQLVTDALTYAKTRGATDADAEVSEGFGHTVTARQREVETIEYNRDKGIGVTVYIGKQRGHASSSDLSAQALRDTVDAALAIARHIRHRRLRRTGRSRPPRARISRSRPASP